MQFFVVATPYWVLDSFGCGRDVSCTLLWMINLREPDRSWFYELRKLWDMVAFSFLHCAHNMSDCNELVLWKLSCRLNTVTSYFFAVKKKRTDLSVECVWDLQCTSGSMLWNVPSSFSVYLRVFIWTEQCACLNKAWTTFPRAERQCAVDSVASKNLILFYLWLIFFSCLMHQGLDI